MPKNYIIEIHPREYGIYKSKKRWQKRFPELKQTSTNTYTFKAEKRELPHYKRVCRKVRVNCLIYEERFARSKNYRASFLKTHPPLPGGKYRCWYCGKKTKDITVDHIISIASAKRDEKIQKYLDRRKIDINGEDNLALCCYKCNQKKGDIQSRFYMRRAKKGRYEFYWKARHSLQAALIVLLAALICFIIYNVYVENFSILNFFTLIKAKSLK